MFSIKISNKKFGQEFDDTVNNIMKYIFTKLNFAEPKVITDRSTIELVSGSEVSAVDDGIIIELLIRKHIVIKESDFKDQLELDKHVSKIKHFCENAKTIEDLKYIPITMRE